MDLTIIIVNWNGGELLHNCLASIAATIDGLKVQVVVVDNDSSDGSRHIAKYQFPQFTVINSGSNLGFAKANNLARPLVQSDLVLFLNPDTEVLKGSLTEMLAHLRQHPEIGALGCMMRSPQGEVHELGLQYFPTPWTEFLNLLFFCTTTRNRFRKFLPYADPHQSGYVTKLYGGCLLCRKSVLDQIGWFDERYFMYAEDVDLCRAIVEEGWKLYYLSTTRIIHVAGGTSEKAPSNFSILMKSESIGKLMEKHYGPSALWFYRFGTFLAAAARYIFLFLLRPLSAWIGQVDFSAALTKYRTLLLWSMGLKKPTIGS